jgi:hypothetical protein
MSEIVLASTSDSVPEMEQAVNATDEQLQNGTVPPVEEKHEAEPYANSQNEHLEHVDPAEEDHSMLSAKTQKRIEKILAENRRLRQELSQRNMHDLAERNMRELQPEEPTQFDGDAHRVPQNGRRTTSHPEGFNGTAFANEAEVEQRAQQDAARDHWGRVIAGHNARMAFVQIDPQAVENAKNAQNASGVAPSAYWCSSAQRNELRRRFA